MTTSADDPDLEIPEVHFSSPRLPNRFARKPGEKTEIRIDGAVAYQLRLIPSNKVLGRFASTLDAWPAIIETVEGGRSSRTLSLDWVFADGRFGSISAGPRLERWARHNNGEVNADTLARHVAARRIADTEISAEYDFSTGRRGVYLERARRGIKVGRAARTLPTRSDR